MKTEETLLKMKLNKKALSCLSAFVGRAGFEHPN